MHACKLGLEQRFGSFFTFIGFATFEGDFYLPKLGKHGCSQLSSQKCWEQVNISDKLWYICS